jgi:hypothetical protein
MQAEQQKDAAAAAAGDDAAARESLPRLTDVSSHLTDLTPGRS